MADPINGLRFDIYERIQLLDEAASIEELEEIELLPHMQAVTQDDQIVLKGHLLLSGVYRSQESNASGERLEYQIPVEISLPPARVQRVEDLKVSIDNFDVDLLSARSLNITGVLALQGLLSEPQQPPVWRDDSFTVVHQAEQTESWYRQPDEDQAQQPWFGSGQFSSRDALDRQMEEADREDFRAAEAGQEDERLEAEQEDFRAAGSRQEVQQPDEGWGDISARLTSQLSGQPEKQPKAETRAVSGQDAREPDQAALREEGNSRFESEEQKAGKGYSHAASQEAGQSYSLAGRQDTDQSYSLAGRQETDQSYSLAGRQETDQSYSLADRQELDQSYLFAGRQEADRNFSFAASQESSGSSAAGEDAVRAEAAKDTYADIADEAPQNMQAEAAEPVYEAAPPELAELQARQAEERREPEAALLEEEKPDLKVAVGRRNAAVGAAYEASGVGLLSSLAEKSAAQQAEIRTSSLAQAETDASASEPASSGDEVEWTKLFLSKSSGEEQFRKVRMYIVQKDDTLESVAARYNVPMKDLQARNKLNEAHITEGQVLYIP